MLLFNVIKDPTENLTRISRWFTAIEKNYYGSLFEDNFEPDICLTKLISSLKLRLSDLCRFKSEENEAYFFDTFPKYTDRFGQ